MSEDDARPDEGGNGASGKLDEEAGERRRDAGDAAGLAEVRWDWLSTAAARCGDGRRKLGRVVLWHRLL
jgi:hypothetical protein